MLNSWFPWRYVGAMAFMLPTNQSCGLGVSSAWYMCRMERMGENRGKEL